MYIRKKNRSGTICVVVVDKHGGKFQELHTKGVACDDSEINKCGYSKFLRIENDVAVSINEDKIKEEEKWDGLKSYVTNTKLSPEEVVVQYHGLWNVRFESQKEIHRDTSYLPLQRKTY